MTEEEENLYWVEHEETSKASIDDAYGVRHVLQCRKTHEEFAAKHPHPPSPDKVRIARRADRSIDRYGESSIDRHSEAAID
ncbi:hypothetical protein F2Q70_00012146 [Brassica cretica]|uniref:Uncharacterized protein n=1 Tax=Brassica cretica TaxID=69181 RepID=A0A8S9M097_BRACR|nr:hypothetical protein F2Q70_00012146 [Brassica cretica]KAF3548913.1 hypothetical protein DY000_02007971 [Brassica cretica]